MQVIIHFDFCNQTINISNIFPVPRFANNKINDEVNIVVQIFNQISGIWYCTTSMNNYIPCSVNTLDLPLNLLLMIF